MSRRGEVLALVQAGGQGSRMDVLTRERAKPALPYGGVHRLIDFALSGLVHADLADVWVSLEYQVTSIDDYLSGGRPWSLDRNRGGFRRIVPQTGTGPATESGFAFGNGDLLLRMSADIEAFGASTLVVCSADHVFNMDLGPVIEEHVASGRTATVLTSEVTKKDASDNVVVVAGNGTARSPAIEHKPSRPSAGTVATEIFVYDTEVLLATLHDLRRELSGEQDPDDAADGDSGIGDFGEHLLPRLVEGGKVAAVPLTGYWRDVGQPGLYLQSHRDLLAGKVDVFDHPGRPVISHWPDRPAARVRASGECRDSLLSPGGRRLRARGRQRARPRRGRREGRRGARQRRDGGLRRSGPAPWCAPPSWTSAARSRPAPRVGAEPSRRAGARRRPRAGRPRLAGRGRGGGGCAPGAGVQPLGQPRGTCCAGCTAPAA